MSESARRDGARIGEQGWDGERDKVGGRARREGMWISGWVGKEERSEDKCVGGQGQTTKVLGEKRLSCSQFLVGNEAI